MPHIEGIDQLLGTRNDMEEALRRQAEGMRDSSVPEPKRTMNYSATGAARDNKGKPPVSWVPYIVLEAIATVLYKNSELGGGKYPKHNWKKGAPYSTPLDSLLRHAMKRADGEKIDPDDGLPHTWKILCNAAFLVFYENKFPELDDLSPAQTEAPSVPPEKSGGASGINLSALMPLLAAMVLSSNGDKNETETK